MQIFKSNRYGDAVVVEDLGNKKLKIRFLNTGHEDVFHISSLKKGEFRDKTVSLPNSPPKNRNVGDIVESNNYGTMQVIELSGKKCKVVFIETGTVVEAYTDNVYSGKVRDAYARVCYGVGYAGEFERVFYWKPAKQLWRNMLKRCYSENDPKGYYGRGYTVSERWLCFANFLEDLPTLRNFDKWLLGHKEGYTKYNLDKDLILEGNKVYCKELCQFITEYENKSAGAINARKLDVIKDRYGWGSRNE